MTWAARARCGGDPHPFDLDTYRTRGDAETACRLVCRGCPVIADCATDAADAGDAGVIRAGVCLWPGASHGRQRPEDTRRLHSIAHQHRQDTT